MQEWKLYPPNSYYLDTTGFDPKNKKANNCSLIPGVPDNVCPSSKEGRPSDKACVGCTHSTGELCGQAFWVKLNQRLHQWRPQNETYVAEIERVLYNGVISQITPDGSHIRQFALLHKKKMPADNNGTCCEGQGTRILGSLPEYLVSFGSGESTDVHLNLFADAVVSLPSRVATGKATLNVTTLFPFGDQVKVTFRSSDSQEQNFTLWLRIPHWVSGGSVSVSVTTADGHTEKLVGKPGTYLALRRAWFSGDTVDLRTPMTLRATRYTGQTTIPGCERYAVEYGPVLLAAVGGSWNNQLDSIVIPGVSQPNAPASWLRPITSPVQMEFGVKTAPNITFVPYFRVQEELFEVYPCFPTGSQPSLPR